MDQEEKTKIEKLLDTSYMTSEIKKSLWTTLSKTRNTNSTRNREFSALLK